MRLISVIVVFTALFGLVLALQGIHTLNQIQVKHYPVETDYYYLGEN